MSTEGEASGTVCLPTSLKMAPYLKNMKNVSQGTKKGRLCTWSAARKSDEQF